MALIKFTSTDYFKAFFLYSLIAALAASIAVHIRLLVDQDDFGIREWINKKFGDPAVVKRRGDETWLKLIVSFLITFIITILIYHIMYWIFGWGAGLLVPSAYHSTKAIKKVKYF